MSDPFECQGPTLVEAIHELRRELAMRKRMYPRWVAAKSLSAKAADRQIKRLETAIETLARMTASEPAA